MSEDSDDKQFLIEGRPVADLKVVELRKELEARSLPKSGNKKELIERLENFLREEQAEQSRQTQQREQQQQPATDQKSPPHAAANMVAQYLAQQQIQLEAARRDADKIRASSSETQPQMVQLVPPAPEPTDQEQQQKVPPAPETSPDKGSSKQGQQSGAEFIPEEPTNQKIPVETKAPTAEEPKVDEIKDSSIEEPTLGGDDEETKSADEKAEEEEEEVGEVRPGSSTSSGGDQEESSLEYKEQMAAESDQPEDQKDEESQPEQQHQEEFVPEEPELSKQTIEGEEEEEEASSKLEEGEEVESEPPVKAAEQQQLDFEHDEEEDEEHAEPADYGGKRRDSRPSPPMMEEQKAAIMESGQIEDDKSAKMEEMDTKDKIGEEKAEEVVSSKEPPVGLVQTVASSMKKEEPVTEEETMTPEGFVRRRAASPARNPPSRWVHIRNLKRPFTKNALLDLLGKFGTVDQDQFWMDSIKSNCIITYENTEQAQLAREHLHNVVWPIASDMALCVEYSSDEKLRRRKAEEQRESAANNSALGEGLGLTIVVDNRAHQHFEALPDVGASVLIQHDKDQLENRKRKAEELAKSQKTLDELFKKTKTLPPIYFLPLSDEEATKRRKKAAVSSGDKHSSSSHHHSKSSGAGSGSHHHSSSSRRNETATTGGRSSAADQRNHNRPSRR